MLFLLNLFRIFESVVPLVSYFQLPESRDVRARKEVTSTQTDTHRQHRQTQTTDRHRHTHTHTRTTQGKHSP